MGSRERKGREEEGGREKNVNDLWVYEKQHVSNAFTSDCCFIKSQMSSNDQKQN